MKFEGEELGDFDVGRVTRAGWFIVLFALAVGCTVAAVGIEIAKANLPKFNEHSRAAVWPFGVAGFAITIGLFVGLRKLAERRGISIIRPKPTTPPDDQ
jgi:hypothetical protein